MKKRETCDECRFLAFDRAVNAYDTNRALCCDPDKPAMGARRVVAVSRIGLPRQIERPVWCRRKKSRRDCGAPTRKGKPNGMTKPRVVIVSPGKKKGKGKHDRS